MKIVGNETRIIYIMVCVAVVSILVVTTRPLVQTEAISGAGKFKLVYSISDTWGETRIIRNEDTKIGYMQSRDRNGNITDMVMVVNSVGEPVRYNDDGSPMPRIEPERWVSWWHEACQQNHYNVNWNPGDMGYKYNHKGEIE